MAEPLVQLIASLSRELHDFREETRSFREETRNWLQRVEQATRRHSTAITAGTISLGGITKAIERLEGMIRDRDAKITNLSDRLRLLEKAVAR